VRYQFLTLVYFIKYGQCPTPQVPESLELSQYLLDKWSFGMPVSTYCQRIVDILSNETESSYSTTLSMSHGECSSAPDFHNADFALNSTQVQLLCPLLQN
jgi:hypothetical protein